VTTDDTPAARTPEAAFMADERALIATLMAGTDAMRKAGVRLLPKAPAESLDAYNYRLAVSVLYNGMRRTVETLAGKPLAEPLKFGDNVPQQIQDWCDDVDLQGRDLHAFAHAVFVQAIADGISHMLVEYPTTTIGATLAEKRTTGARPYFLHLKHDQILGWKSERISGVETLIELRFKETVTEPKGRWLVQQVEQIRVLMRDAWETYRKDAQGNWALHENGAVTLGAIPLATVYTDRCGYMQARPPLLDLAHLNVEHWQSSSDQSNILHIARVPILFASGFTPEKLVIGAGSAVTNDDPTATLQYVEHTGAAIDAGRLSIKDIEERMSLMGAQLLVKKPGTRTATEKAIDTAEANSALSLMARNLEDSLEYALQFMADWEQLGPAGEVELTGEIGGIDDMEIEGLMKARELGLLSAETVFHEMQRRGLIADDIEWEEEAARLAAEPKPDEEADATLPLPAAPGAASPGAQPAADFGPLVDGIASLVAALGESNAPAAPAAPDFAPLIEAIRAQPAPQITVNVPEQQAPQVTFAAGAFNVESPEVTVNQAPITVNPAPITVEGAQITVQPAQVIQAKPSQVEFELTNGEITGARLN
jgi:hypothetical protein